MPDEFFEIKASKIDNLLEEFHRQIHASFPEFKSEELIESIEHHCGMLLFGRALGKLFLKRASKEATAFVMEVLRVGSDDVLDNAPENKKKKENLNKFLLVSGELLKEAIAADTDGVNNIQ
jgi:hypothetical protein